MSTGRRDMLGRLLRHIRAGDRKLTMCQGEFSSVPETILVTSKSFSHKTQIPDRFTQSGDNLSPNLEWKHLPSGTRDIVVIVEDPDAPLPKPFVHAIVYNLYPPMTEIPEGAIPNTANILENALEPPFHAGKNTFGRMVYLGPAPIPGHGVHHYYFQVFALDSGLTFRQPPNRKDIIREMGGHVLAKGFLVGTYER